MNAGIKRNDVLVALHVATLVSNATVRASQLGWLLGKKGFEERVCAGVISFVARHPGFVAGCKSFR